MQSAILTIVLLGQVASPTPNNALGWAIAHQVEQSADTRALWRYLWIPPYAVPEHSTYKWDERHVGAALSYAINEAASQTGVIVQPEVIANGWMIACYLPNYASSTKPSAGNPSKTELQSLVDVWDSLATDDPYFHITRENQKAEGVIDRVAVIAPHITQEHAKVLGEMNASPALVYRADWFIEQLLSLHYRQFMQFPPTKAEVFKTIGADEKLSQRLDGDQRVAIFTSHVTGKPRRVDRIQGAAGRFGTGAIWTTFDLFDETVQVDRHPLYNLLGFVADGGESIFERQNGLHGYLLFNQQGQLVDEAPPNLVADHTIPGPPDGPGTRRLAGAISCIRCHGPAEGLQPAPNDVQALLQNGTDILDDLSSNKSQSDVVLRLAGLYAGDFDRRIVLGRDDYTLAVRRATRMPGIPAGMDVVETAAITSAIFGNYTYNRVDAGQAIREFGLSPSNKDGVGTLDRCLPRVGSDGQGNAIRANVVIESLRAGLFVRRRDFEQVYGPAMAALKQRN